MLSFLSILNVCLITCGALLASRRVLHYFQLESYQFLGYKNTLRRQAGKAIAPYFVLGVLAVIASILPGSIAESIVLLLGGYALFALSLKRPEKKKFVVTARVKRLIGVHAVVLFVFYCFVAPCMGAIGIGLITALIPSLLALSGLIAWPIERFIFYLYFNDAKKRLLANDRLIRIGITGSYGKTSVKFILNTILSQKYNVLCTPSSFNTPMGVTRIVRERLEPAHQVFIGEMGARHVGEIKELCNLVNPHIGILTAVGPQHLDTFRTIERITKTKNELIEALPNDGFAVFCNDDAIVTSLYQKAVVEKALVGTPDSDAWADEISLSHTGSSFTLHLKGMEPFRCQTVLLGAHNIANIVACAKVAQHLHLSAQQIARGIALLKPVEHRLQLLKSAGGITVIDDAFNTNPRSSKIALDVLSAFPGRRIIVTPGMVELGKDEDSYNHAFGEKMASCCDLVFLVGKKHTKPIYDGLIQNGFPVENIFTTQTLDEAIRTMNPMLREGDVIMYENDLPDHYSEV